MLSDRTFELIGPGAATGGNAAAFARVPHLARMHFDIEFTVCAAPPSAGKESVPIVQNRPCNFHDTVQPIVVRTRIGAEHVRETGAAGKTNGAVDEQELAMIAQEQAGKSAPARRIKKHEIDAGSSNAGPIRLSQSARPECIEQRPHSNAALRGAGECCDEAVRNLT